MNHQPCPKHVARQRGLTLVELLVAVALMLMVTAGTVALYSVNAGSNKTVDASQSLDDTARFVFELVGQAIRNAGYPGAVPEDADEGTLRRTVVNPFDACSATPKIKPCPILGFDNSKVAGTTGAVGGNNSGGVNASDSLAVRFNGASDSVKQRDQGRGNESITTCGGNAVALTTDESQLGMSIFWLKEYNGEPELYCTEEYYQADSPKGWKKLSNPVARGVEVFQVVYGLDCAGSCSSDGIPDRWVRATDIKDVDWVYVRAVRVGLVLRGPPGSSQGSREVEDATEHDLYPLGKGFSAGQSASDFKFTPSKTDGRLRRVYTSTFMLRNVVDKPPPTP